MKKPIFLNLSGHRTLGEERMARIRAGANTSATVAISRGPTTGGGVATGSARANLGSVGSGLG